MRVTPKTRPLLFLDFDDVTPSGLGELEYENLRAAFELRRRSVRSLRQACEFFRFGLRGGANLTDKLNNQIPYVLRHFPDISELDLWARADELNAQRDPVFRVWLLPERKS